MLIKDTLILKILKIVLKTMNCGSSVPGQGTKIAQVTQCGQTSNEILLRKFQNILQKMNT